jgi:hypothetical protein
LCETRQLITLAIPAAERLALVVIQPIFYQSFAILPNQVGLAASHAFNVINLFNETALSISHTTSEKLFHTKNIRGSGIYHKIII